jgi:hypothetical protein
MKYRVKKRWPAFGISALIILGGIIFIRCFLQDDPSGYKELMERANPAISMETNQAYRASQQRKGVQKEFWRIKGDQRLVALLNCSEAELVYEKEEEKQVIAEHMKDVRCLIQEELFYLDLKGERVAVIPADGEGYLLQQTVRFVEAAAAKYHYSSETLEAYNVTMELYTLPGHDLPRSIAGFKPSMRGKADVVNINIIEKGLNFKADQFKGTLF